MNRAICTISTYSHLAQSFAMINSLQLFMPQVQAFILVVDKSSLDVNIQAVPASIELLYANSNDIVPYTAPHYKKYRKGSDSLRWSLKPALLKFIFEQRGIESAFYADNDLYFFENPSFLFDELERHSFLLCPHWRIHDPKASRAWFEVNFRDGVFNAGFVGATKDGNEIVDWWREACLYECRISRSRGLYVDQKYLDLVPAIFENIGIIQHRGCNVAYWNQIENKRSMKEGKVFINERWPLIFMHITSKLIASIMDGAEPALEGYYRQYLDAKATVALLR
ncbi:MAG: hypothetical protein SFW35_07105 [Chitinophagales bacterium]|nr:hypothetical protein [Chitinophagales bacterium]